MTASRLTGMDPRPAALRVLAEPDGWPSVDEEQKAWAVAVMVRDEVMRMDEKWTPATFEIAMSRDGSRADHQVFGGMETVEGETWGPFGINTERHWGTRHWIVTHLPTGYQLVAAESKAAAKRFCREVAPLTDWSTVQPGRCPPDIRDAVIEAYHRARGAMFTAPAAVSAGAGQ